MTQYNAV